MTFRRTKNITDEELILSYKKDKNKKWVGVLYKRYAHLVLGVCLNYLQNEEKAKDATTEIFEQLFEKLLNQKIEKFNSWIYVVSKNHCFMELRKQKTAKHKINSGNNLPIDEQKLANTDSDLELKKLREIEYEELEKAISNLKDEQRKCIELFYLNQLSYDQVASKTGMEVKKVKSAIQNGKRNLKIALIEKNEY